MRGLAARLLVSRAHRFGYPCTPGQRERGASAAMASIAALALADAPTNRRQRSQRFRRGRALAVSLALHGVLLFLYFGAAAGAMVSGGAGEDRGDDVTISLASLAGGRGPASDPQAQQLALLYRKVLAAQAEVSAVDRPQTPSQNLQSLLDDIDRAAGSQGSADSSAQSQGQSPDGRAPTSNAANHQRVGDHASAAAAEGPGVAASSGGIWGQIEPCWRGLPDVSRVPVTLQITLDDKGRVSKPPQIIRPPAAMPDEKRLISEARALTAIAGCVPYHSADFLAGQRQFTVQFAASGAD
jgi:hypothetical protein